MQTQTFAQNPKMNECIDACNETHEAALRTLAWATSEGSDAATPEFVRLLADCAEITQTAANFMLRGSELHHETCKACEEVCEAVFEACEQSGIDEVEDFKDQVKTCADQCREMSSAGGRTPSEGNFNANTRGGRGGREASTRSTGGDKSGNVGKGRNRSTERGAR